MKKIIITIDGPSGAGKTTVSRAVAKQLGYIYVDTGALYRGLAVMIQKQGIDPDDDAALARVCENLVLELVPGADETRVLANKEDITGFLRTPEISMLASAISARPLVRQWLLSIQQDLGARGQAVFEGRDMGTVVFPKAEAKFFLDADSAARATRRHLELAAKGPAPGMEEVARDMAKRDKDDSSRSLAPLKPAKDAIFVDSTQLNVNEVVDTILGHVRSKIQ